MDEETVAAWGLLTQAARPLQIARREGFYWLRTIASQGRNDQPIYEWTIGVWTQSEGLNGCGWSALDRHNDITYSDADFDMIGPMIALPDDLSNVATTGI